MARIKLLSVATFSLALSAGAGFSDSAWASAQECAFGISRKVAPPTIAGPANITTRVDFIPQDDAPIRIVGIDLSPASLSTGRPFTVAYSLEVENVSNEAATAVHPMVQLLRHGRKVGNAAGPIVRRRLAPGERLRIDDKTVSGPMDDDTRIQVSISIVGFDACTWKDQRWAESGRSASP